MGGVDQLAAGVAHEFNNVLQIVRGYVGFARNALPEGSGTRADLDRALEATDRAAGLSARLLQFARSEDSEGVADAGDALEALLLLVKPIIGENIEVESEIDPDLPWVAAGDSSLRQALLNLSINARDAMPRGGKLRLVAEEVVWDGTGQLDVGVLSRARYVRLVVEDSGEGMEPATTDRMFDPFFTTKPAGQGSGLGLPMVAGFVRGVSGAIRVESRVGLGTKFELFLPIADETTVSSSDGEELSALDPIQGVS